MSQQPRTDQISYSYTTNVNGLEEENRFLKENVESLEKELEKFKKGPLIVCELKDVIENKAVIKLSNGNEFFVEISETCGKIFPGDSVLAEQKNLTVVKKISPSKKFDVDKFVIVEKPTVTWNDIGGLKEEEQEIREVVELPLKNPELFKQVGIEPPKGVLLYGPPGTGKTLLAKAVAQSTNATFIEVVGSELVQKFIGEGAKLVKEIFQLAREKAPSIVFIDELDSIASMRIEVGTSGEREVQRTFMQLLAEIDGFHPLENVKIIGCTNRKDILDPAITRPGRLDRMLYIPIPSDDARAEIFKIHTSRMSLGKISIPEIVKVTDGFSGAELKCVATEAGYFAIRNNRIKVSHDDFLQAVEKVCQGEFVEDKDYEKMFV